MIRIAILDDYQNASLEMADWSPLAGRAVIIVFNDHLSISTNRRAPPAVRRGLRHARAHTAATVSHRALAATEADRIDRSSQRGIDVEAAAERDIVVAHTDTMHAPPSR